MEATMALPAELEQNERVLAARQHHAEFLTHHPEFEDPIDLLMQDPHVAPEFKRAVSAPHEFVKPQQKAFLDERYAKQERRKLLPDPEPVTGYGPLLTAEQIAAMDETWSGVAA